MRRPSFPTVISLIALFVALGGTSYAVVKLPANSVGNAQVKRNAITTSKIRNGTIGRADLSSAAAGRRGPRGPQGPPGSGSGLSPLQAWQPLVFAGVWTNYGSPYDTAAYRTDQLGQVHLRGLVTKNGAVPAKDDVIATLPPAARPKARMVFSVQSGALVARVDVLPNGNITWIGGGATEKDYTSLAAVSFWTD